MTAPRAAFRQADVTRAIRGVRKLGLPIREVVVDRNGSIHVLTGLEDAAPSEAEDLEQRMREAFGG